ncbi:hypothetical protein A0H81_05231 [Grifola frondosa]|uniref:Uncharacterized protein n=1 Tax=Grifola frondosa TaxID=5627 RepID=A0A1C7MCQ8_GRIFR|nr:hypothetical protein A0H81_05231 [Grifola frondosa]
MLGTAQFHLCLLPSPRHVLSPASGGYDERLLANAPVATRAEKQEGYDVDLLENDAAVGRNNSTTPIEAQTKWVVALVVALIVVVAIAVGVGVGVGARHHHAIASHNATSSGATQSVPAASQSISAPASAVTSSASANGPVVGEWRQISPIARRMIRET